MKNQRLCEERKKKLKGDYAANSNVKKVLTVANGITLLRIAGTVELLFLTPLSPLFLGLYTLTGLTDALDGWVARKTGTAGDFGARLDSVADLIYCAVMIIRLFPVLSEKLPVQIWYAVAAIVLVRLGAYCTAVIKYRRFVTLHTWLNKLTGAALFLLPYILTTSWSASFCWVVCVLGFVASSEELVIHLVRKSCCADTKSFFQKENGQRK